MKKTLIALGLSAILTLYSCSSKSIDKPENIVDVKPGAGYVYRISRRLTENRLFELAKKTSVEDIFLIYNGRVYDIGRNEIKFNCTLNRQQIVSILKSDPPKSKIIYMEHIHPVKPAGKKNLRVPGPEDFYTHAFFKQYLKKEFGLELKSKVFDHEGEWDIESEDNFWLNTPNLKEKLEKAARILLDRVIDNKEFTREEKIERYIIEANHLMGTKLSYIPIR